MSSLTNEKEIAMAKCECIAGCLFFNDKMKDSSGMGSIYKKKYCEGSNANCARYMVFKKLGKPAVPENLYPNMVDRANKILQG
jgi:hypothetical protein